MVEITLVITIASKTFTIPIVLRFVVPNENAFHTLKVWKLIKLLEERDLNVLVLLQRGLFRMYIIK